MASYFEKKNFQMIERELQRLQPGFISLIIDSPYEPGSLALRASFRDQSCLDLHLNLSMGWVGSFAGNVNGNLQPITQRLQSNLGVKRTASSSKIAQAYYQLYSMTWHQMEEFDRRQMDSDESHELALVRLIEAEFHKLVPPAPTAVLDNIFDEGYMLRVSLQESLWIDFFLDYDPETASGNWVVVPALDPEADPSKRQFFKLEVGLESSAEVTADQFRRVYGMWWDIVADAVKGSST